MYQDLEDNHYWGKPMKEYFKRDIVNEAVKHAQSVVPEESCGFIVDDKYMPMENEAEDRVHHFQINPKSYIKLYGKIQAVVHSHVDYAHASKRDQEQQIATGVPWGIIALKESGAVTHRIFWGDQLEPQDLIGRPFFYGVYDCYALCRDYLRTRGKTMPPYPRENLWWKKDGTKGMLIDGFESLDTLIEVKESEIKKGDLVFLMIGANVVNHSGIYMGDGNILHHFVRRLSNIEPLHKWKQNIHGFYRYTGD